MNKKLFVAAAGLLIALFLSLAAFADDLAVHAVGDNRDSREPMRFDDMTFGRAYKIKNYVSVTLLGFKFVNMFAQWEDGQASAKLVRSMGDDENNVFAKKIKNNRGDAYENCGFKLSGNEADFAWLKADVQNLQKSPVNFMKDISVKVIYDDEYEYTGWVRQFNYDYSKSEIYRYNETSVIGWPVCLSPIDEFSISPMYKGHYVLGCTLPNAIVEDKTSPLRMIITIGENEFIYNIRK